jgi:hypothetical protein
MEDYDPKKSLVISPAKMRRFYEETKIEDEIYPWNSKLIYAPSLFEIPSLT